MEVSFQLLYKNGKLSHITGPYIVSFHGVKIVLITQECPVCKLFSKIAYFSCFVLGAFVVLSLKVLAIA